MSKCIQCDKELSNDDLLNQCRGHDGRCMSCQCDEKKNQQFWRIYNAGVIDGQRKTMQTIVSDFEFSCELAIKEISKRWGEKIKANEHDNEGSPAK